MHSLFNLDSPVMRLFSRIADLFLLSLLTVVCSLPVVTLGMALIAASKVSQDLLLLGDCPVVRTFLTSFRENWRQGLVCSVLILAGLGLFFLDVLWLYSAPVAAPSAVVGVALVVAAILLLGTLLRLPVMVARYHNPLKRHLYNAFYFSCIHFLRSAGITLTAGLPILVLGLSPGLFLRTLLIWTIFFPGGAVYLINTIACRSFTELEGLSAINSGK